MILEVKDLTFIADYYLICSADNTIQVQTITENILNVLAKDNLKPLGIEGLRHAHWVLIDYGDVIVHIFEDQTRQYYNLEKLWLDAPQISTDDEGQNSLGRQN